MNWEENKGERRSFEVRFSRDGLVSLFYQSRRSHLLLFFPSRASVSTVTSNFKFKFDLNFGSLSWSSYSLSNSPKYISNQLNNITIRSHGSAILTVKTPCVRLSLQKSTFERDPPVWVVASANLGPNCWRLPQTTADYSSACSACSACREGYLLCSTVQCCCSLLLTKNK